ncbi:MAG TPA: hypothetical protein PLS50_08475 [Candidatus Dojkabacteria bacterium]|nr:hypothetical protein [Candidatus Dojkabacteria bacterium]
MIKMVVCNNKDNDKVPICGSTTSEVHFVLLTAAIPLWYKALIVRASVIGLVT